MKIRHVLPPRVPRAIPAEIRELLIGECESKSYSGWSLNAQSLLVELVLQSQLDNRKWFDAKHKLICGKLTTLICNMLTCSEERALEIFEILYEEKHCFRLSHRSVKDRRVYWKECSEDAQNILNDLIARDSETLNGGLSRQYQQIIRTLSTLGSRTKATDAEVERFVQMVWELIRRKPDTLRLVIREMIKLLKSVEKL